MWYMCWFIKWYCDLLDLLMWCEMMLDLDRKMIYVSNTFCEKNKVEKSMFYEKNGVCKGYVMPCFCFEKCLSVCLAREWSLLDLLKLNSGLTREWVPTQASVHHWGSWAVFRVGRSGDRVCGHILVSHVVDVVDVEVVEMMMLRLLRWWYWWFLSGEWVFTMSLIEFGS